MCSSPPTMTVAPSYPNCSICARTGVSYVGDELTPQQFDLRHMFIGDVRRREVTVKRAPSATNSVAEAYGMNLRPCAARSGSICDIRSHSHLG